MCLIRRYNTTISIKLSPDFASFSNVINNFNRVFPTLTHAHFIINDEDDIKTNEIVI